MCAGSSCTPVASNCSTGSTVYGTACCSGTCSGYTTGYNNWDACHYDATFGYIQWGTSPISSGSYCGSCETDASPVRGCGACNPAVPASSVTPVSPCLGGSVSGMTHNATNWTWNCLSGGAGSNAMGCSSVYIPNPSVDLYTIPAGITKVNLNNGTQLLTNKPVDLGWNITNAAQACPTGCNCNAIGSWGGAKAYPDPGTPNDISVGVGGGAYTLTCNNNENGMGSDLVNISAECDIVSWSDGCNVNCGNGQNPTHTMQTNCIPTNTMPVCTMPACPISSEWKEVRP